MILAYLLAVLILLLEKVFNCLEIKFNLQQKQWKTWKTKIFYVDSKAYQKSLTYHNSQVLQK